MIAADQLCEKGGLDFRHVFARQYSLSKATLPRVESWKRPKRLSGWGLTHCPKLECQNIVDKHGKPVGWFLGTAVDQNGKVISKSALTLSAAISDANFWSQVEKQIPFLAGRYIAIIITTKGKRIYFDPVMDLPVVFNAKEKLVGSSPLMVLSRPVQINHRIHWKLILKEGGNYGMQQTCDPDVRRGLSNHFLDLEAFALHRHWPNEEDTFDHEPDKLGDTAEFIVARLGQITEALLENYSCLLPLSGGADCRTLAFSAKAKAHLAKCYSHRTNWITGLDCYAATFLANALGKELRIIDAFGELQKGDASHKNIKRLRWDFCHRTGYQKPPTNAELIACDSIDEADFVLRGNILDMTRANQWPQNLKFSVENAIAKLAIGGRPPADNLAYWAPEYTNWFNTLPLPARKCTYELAFTEQLLPNTLGGQLIGYGRAAYINPFNDRRLIKISMSIDPKIRKSGQLNKALHAACGAPDTPFTSEIKRNTNLKQRVGELFEL